MKKTEISDFKGEYGFLSNFYNTDIVYKGLVYPNAEAAFQAQKCISEEAKLKYTQKMNPYIAKQLGKREPDLPNNWKDISYTIMLNIIRIKFENPILKQKLIATGDTFLEEGNTWHDNKWGHCKCSKCRNKKVENLLGKILMQVRNEII